MWQKAFWRIMSGHTNSRECKRSAAYSLHMAISAVISESVAFLACYKWPLIGDLFQKRDFSNIVNAHQVSHPVGVDVMKSIGIPGALIDQVELVFVGHAYHVVVLPGWTVYQRHHHRRVTQTDFLWVGFVNFIAWSYFHGKTLEGVKAFFFFWNVSFNIQTITSSTCDMKPFSF